MSRRIEIELTSARPDGTWTWRAAGAREPRGVLDGGLLYAGASAGDVVRAEADFEIEGITVVAVLPPKEKRREEPQRIELIVRDDAPGVTTQLFGKSGGRDRDRDRGPRRDGDGPRRDRPARTDGPRPERTGDRPDRPARSDAGGQDRSGGRPARSPGSGPDGAARSSGPGGRDARPGGWDRPAGPGEAGGRDGAPRRERTGGDGRSSGGPRREGGRPDAAERAKARRLTPGHEHRQAVVATLRPEEQAVADQVLKGGLPAVRTALHLEREKATSEGRPVPDTESLLTLAEQLLPRLKAAEWRDRAEAAVKAGDDLALRDLRSVVAGADVAREEESRDLATQLRATLERRVEAQRTDWVNDLGRHLDEGRVIRALQLSARPPDPSTRLPADMAVRVAAVAGAAMTAEVTPERWLALLEAVSASPVRRSVQPAGLPAEPGADLLRAAHQQSGRIPALATMLGVSMPPPPGPRTPPPPGARPASPRGGRPAGPGGRPPGSGPRPPAPGTGPRPPASDSGPGGGRRGSSPRRPAGVSAPDGPSHPRDAASGSDPSPVIPDVEPVPGDAPAYPGDTAPLEEAPPVDGFAEAIESLRSDAPAPVLPDVPAPVLPDVPASVVPDVPASVLPEAVEHTGPEGVTGVTAEPDAPPAEEAAPAADSATTGPPPVAEAAPTDEAASLGAAGDTDPAAQPQATPPGPADVAEQPEHLGA